MFQVLVQRLSRLIACGLRQVEAARKEAYERLAREAEEEERRRQQEAQRRALEDDEDAASADGEGGMFSDEERDELEAGSRMAGGIRRSRQHHLASGGSGSVCSEVVGTGRGGSVGPDEDSEGDHMSGVSKRRRLGREMGQHGPVVLGDGGADSELSDDDTERLAGGAEPLAVSKAFSRQN
eukprot:scaffold237869_cov34-Prasinocladus_malaysianus.AAC.1